MCWRPSLLYVDVSEDAPWDADAALFREKVTDWPPRYTANPNTNWAARIYASTADFAACAAPPSPGSSFSQCSRLSRRVSPSIASRKRSGNAMKRWRSLAASSRDAAHSNPALALALAGESALATPVPTWQATSALVSARVAMSESGAQQIREPLIQDTSRANVLIFNSDGRLLVNSVDDGTLQLWDPSTRRPIGEPLETNAAVVALGPGGLLAASGDDGVVPIAGSSYRPSTWGTPQGPYRTS